VVRRKGVTDRANAGMVDERMAKRKREEMGNLRRCCEALIFLGTSANWLDSHVTAPHFLGLGRTCGIWVLDGC
jgi:hypothetical protein